MPVRASSPRRRRPLVAPAGQDEHLHRGVVVVEDLALRRLPHVLLAGGHEPGQSLADQFPLRRGGQRTPKRPLQPLDPVARDAAAVLEQDPMVAAEASYFAAPTPSGAGAGKTSPHRLQRSRALVDGAPAGPCRDPHQRRGLGLPVDLSRLAPRAASPRCSVAWAIVTFSAPVYAAAPRRPWPGRWARPRPVRPRRPGTPRGPARPAPRPRRGAYGSSPSAGRRGPAAAGRSMSVSPQLRVTNTSVSIAAFSLAWSSALSGAALVRSTIAPVRRRAARGAGAPPAARPSSVDGGSDRPRQARAKVRHERKPEHRFDRPRSAHGRRVVAAPGGAPDTRQFAAR